MMSVRVLFFGKLTDLVNQPDFYHETEPGIRIADLYEQLARASKLPSLEQKPNIKVAVNQQLVDWEQSLSPGDELAFLPPVTGG